MIHLFITHNASAQCTKKRSLPLSLPLCLTLSVSTPSPQCGLSCYLKISASPSFLCPVIYWQCLTAGQHLLLLHDPELKADKMESPQVPLYVTKCIFWAKNEGIKKNRQEKFFLKAIQNLPASVYICEYNVCVCCSTKWFLR